MTAPTLLHDLLDRAAAEHGRRPAVSSGAATGTYRSVAAASRSVAGLLAGRGVGRGDRVVLALPPDVLLPALLYGCSRAGAVFCVLGERAPAPAYAHVLDDAGPALVITDNPDAAGLAAERGIGVLPLAELRALTSADGVPAGGAPGPIPVDPACLIYTSGSTGLPKAVVSTHAQLTFAASAIQSQLCYRPGDVVFCALPLSFDYGLYQIFLATLAGAKVHLAAAEDAGPRLLAELHRTAATVLPAVPGMAGGLVRLLSRPAARPPRLRLLTNTGSAMPDGVLRALRDRIPGIGVQLMFGLTECKRTTIMPLDGDLHRPGSVGRALPGTEVFAVDPAGNRLPPGEVGELVVRGPHVMAGYWRRPDLTAQRFPSTGGLFPRLRTGDYGWLDGDGYLYFLGRRDDLYKERGFRVSATEVEVAATRIAGVEAAALLPPGDGRAEALLLAVTRLAPHEVLELLRDQLDEYKVPRRCQVVERVPRTTNGKIDRAALAGLAQPPAERHAAGPARQPAADASHRRAAGGAPDGPAWLADLETPAYLYDLDELRRCHRRLRETLPEPAELYYSFKANPHPAIVAALRTAGCLAEVCSPGELATALDAGFAAEHVLYTGPGKRDRDVAGAMKAGVTWFSVDSPYGLEQVERVALAQGAEAGCLLRVNDSTPVPGQGLAMTGVASQFGADLEWILAEPARFASRAGARLAGLHLYMGTNVTGEEALVAQLVQSAGTARRLADACGLELEVLDLGGGFGAPFARAGELPAYPNLAERLGAALDSAFPAWRSGSPRVAFESGRYLTATCGTLLARVLDAKASHGQHVLVLESGINHLGGMSGLRRLPPVVPTLWTEAAQPAQVGPAIIAGPLCTPLDSWARGVAAPPARPGDLLRVPNVGAYGLSASLLAFLGHPAPLEVVIDAGRIVHTSRLTYQRLPLPMSSARADEE